MSFNFFRKSGHVQAETLPLYLCFTHTDNFDTTLSLNNLTIMDIGMKSSSRTVERFISKSGHLERGEHGE